MNVEIKQLKLGRPKKELHVCKSESCSKSLAKNNKSGYCTTCNEREKRYYN